jgi:molybdopterin/thiamine biosynthesis adenylyltransferase
MLNDLQKQRYARQLILAGVGADGQEKLLKSSVLVVGAGGLGSPVLYYLAAAGVGRLGIADPDTVAISNLHRQILYATPDVGKAKVDVAADRLRALNPDVTVATHPFRVADGNIDALFAEYDVVVDAPDNIATRYLVNDACWRLGKPLVEGAVLGFSGMLMTIVPPKTPCYRCLYPNPPKEGTVPSSAEVGIMGMVPGVIGSLQALEAVKVLLGVSSTLTGRVLFFDGLEPGFEEMRLERNPACPLCGKGAAGRRTAGSGRQPARRSPLRRDTAR